MVQTIKMMMLIHLETYDFLKWNLYCVGLDAAGKTTVLYRMKMGETVTTIPTIGKKPFLQKTF